MVYRTRYRVHIHESCTRLFSCMRERRGRESWNANVIAFEQQKCVPTCPCHSQHPMSPHNRSYALRSVPLFSTSQDPLPLPPLHSRFRSWALPCYAASINQTSCLHHYDHLLRRCLPIFPSFRASMLIDFSGEPTVQVIT
jgi:hypothetical protein